MTAPARRSPSPLPVPRRENYAVAVTVGLESLLQTRTHGLRVALGFAVPTIVLVTVLVHLTVRQLLGQPLVRILGTMHETREGNLRARATLTRRDELGTIATGLNEMLDQLERFNRSLHERIDEATRDLSLRNAQLAASQSELFALRESLGHAERVAALGQVAANVVHQAGTPLNLVSGYIQMIRDDPRTDDRTRSRLRTVDEQIQQVTRVLRTMLDHARQPSRRRSWTSRTSSSACGKSPSLDWRATIFGCASRSPMACRRSESAMSATRAGGLRG